MPFHIGHGAAKLEVGQLRTFPLPQWNPGLDQVEAFKEPGIIPSFVPMHTFYWGDWHRDTVFGPERAANSFFGSPIAIRCLSTTSASTGCSAMPCWNIWRPRSAR